MYLHLGDEENLVSVAAVGIRHDQVYFHDWGFSQRVLTYLLLCDNESKSGYACVEGCLSVGR